MGWLVHLNINNSAWKWSLLTECDMMKVFAMDVGEGMA